MNFYTVDNPPKHKGSTAGTGYEKVYVKRLNKKGEEELVLKGKQNTYAKIQASVDDVDLFKQIQKFGLDTHGSLKDIRARFMVEDGTETIDLSYNGSFNDYHNKLLEAEETFKSFSPEVRQFYGNDINRFKTSLINKTLDEDYYKMSKMFRHNDPVMQNLDQNISIPGQNASAVQPEQNAAAVQPVQNASAVQQNLNNGGNANG